MLGDALPLFSSSKARDLAMLDNTEGNSPNDIAIVGMALRVPGARTVDQFWQNLRCGTESIRTLSQDELLQSGETLDRLQQPNYVPRAADLADMEMFDPDFFGMSQLDAGVMDPQHRHFLECAWEAIEDAGRMPDQASGPVGVFAGCGMGSYFYFNVCSNRALVDQVGMFLLRHTGNDKDFLSTRASFAFDLRGPSVNVQTACSTSLVAIHHACQSLLNGECDMALAGGVTIELPHRRGYLHQEGEILSPDGHCRAFDHRAGGTVFGSGAGIVVLRRLSDALAGGDNIHAVIKATAINNDGSSKAGYLAPSVTGQAEAIVEAMGLAGIDAESIQYVECHGTGTALGDPIEIEALTQAYRQATDATGFCRVGSLKTNIGHLDTAAGVVGVIKTALAIKHGEIPPTLGFERANPAIDFAASPFIVCNELTPWPSTLGKRRRAAVNSLGVGGTNAHAILEQAPHRSRDNGIDDRGPFTITLSARYKAGLDIASANLAEWLQRHPEASLGDVAHTLLTGRKRFEHHRVIPFRDREDALVALTDKKRAVQQARVEHASGAVFLFPGGGAQHRGMGADLYKRNGFFRAVVDEGLSYLEAKAADDVRAAWFTSGADKEGGDPFLRPSVQLPAILIIEVAISRTWMRAGVMPLALIGHSMGENAAACIAGVLDFRDAVRLVRLRGELFETVPRGGMLRVPLSVEALKALMPDTLDIASINAPELSVVSGSEAELDLFVAALEAKDLVASRIPIDIAAHSRMLDGMLPRWEGFVRSLTLRAPKIPIVSNLTGEWLTDAQATDPSYWVHHLRSTVLFASGAAKLAADAGRIFIDVGPGKTAAALMKAQGSVSGDQVINSLPHPDEAFDDDLHLLAAMGRASLCGLPVDASVLAGAGKPHRISLPTYPFNHKRYFIEPAKPAVQGDQLPVLVKEADPSRWLYRPFWKQSLPDCEAEAESVPQRWLVFIDSDGPGDALVKQFRSQGHDVTTVRPGDAYRRRSPEDYLLCPELGATGYRTLMESLSVDGRLPTRILHLWLAGENSAHRAGSDNFHRNLDHGFYSMLHLASAVGEAGGGEPVHYTIVTRGAHRVASETVTCPEKAMVLGPGLVLPRETPGSTVRFIDLETTARTSKPKAWRLRPSSAALVDRTDGDELLWQDLMGAPKSEVVAYRGGKRWTRSYRPVAVRDEKAATPTIRRDGAYLFTGGLGDIATSLAGHLARRFNARLALVGRTKLPPRSEWQGYLRQNPWDAISRGIETILRLEADGAQVFYACANITDAGETEAAITGAVHRFGRLDGVFHTAGVVDDALMQGKAIERVEAVLAPKVIGTRVLDAALREADIDFLVLFSSTSTVTAPAGQADYVAANAYLDAYADSRASLAGRKTVSLHWGIWNETGLAARGVGSKLVPAQPAQQVAPGSFYRRWQRDNGIWWLESEIGPDTHWVLNEHRLVSGEAVLPGTAYVDLITLAAREHGIAGAITLRDLSFISPLVLAGGTSAILQVAIQRAGSRWRVQVRAAAAGHFIRHAEAFLEAAETRQRTSLDIAAIEQRLPSLVRADAGGNLASAQERHIQFGPRWKILRETRFGESEALARISLNSEHRSDLDGEIGIHAAILDIATGFAIPLIKAFRSSDVLWAPASYGAMRLYAPLPQHVVSHVRLSAAADQGEDYASFDITIADQAGRILLEAGRFLMQKLANDRAFAEAPPMITSHAASEPFPASAASMRKLAAQVRHGIRPDEGLNALLTGLASGLTQPIISSINLDALLANAAAVTTGANPAAAFERPDIDVTFVTPRNPVEEALAGFWQELLGISRIGMNDSFFDLGGHSLAAVRLFQKIKKAFDVDLPISTLFSAPTIAECAEMLLEKKPAVGADQPEQSAEVLASNQIHLTLMHPGKRTDTMPLFICAGMFGNILNLRHLAMHLGTDRPVYGLQARGLYGDMDPHETFEEMAADLLAEMRSVQPQGPYLLAGYSGGGITAFEIARQLQAVDQEVLKVIMLDTPQPTQSPLTVADKLRMKSQDIGRQRLGYLNSWLRDRAAWHAEMRRKRDGVEGDAVQLADQFNNHRIEGAFRRALTRYTVARADGPVTVYRPRPVVHYQLSGGRRLMANRNIILDDNGWSVHVDRLRVVEVPGDHDTMVLEPHVRTLAGHMRREIDEAIASRAPHERVVEHTSTRDRLVQVD